MKKTRDLVIIAMLIAVDVLLSRMLVIYITPTLRISLGFIAAALIGIRFGPFVAALAAGVADILGFFIYNASGAPFFPGFTISAIVMGLLYGLILHKKSFHIGWIVLAAASVILVVELGMNTMWLSMMYKDGFIALLPGRLIKAAIMLPAQTILISTVWKVLLRAVPGFSKMQPKVG